MLIFGTRPSVRLIEGLLNRVFTVLVTLYQQDDDLEVTGDSGISLGEQQPAHPQAQLPGAVGPGARERELTILMPRYDKVNTCVFHLLP